MHTHPILFNCNCARDGFDWLGEICIVADLEAECKVFFIVKFALEGTWVGEGSIGGSEY